MNREKTYFYGNLIVGSVAIFTSLCLLLIILSSPVKLEEITSTDTKLQTIIDNQAAINNNLKTIIENQVIERENLITVQENIILAIK